MERKIREYLLWKATYAPAAAKSYRSPLLNIRKLDSLADVIKFKERIEDKYSDSSVAYSMTVLRDFIKFLNTTGKSKIPTELIKVPRFIPKKRTVAQNNDAIKMVNTLNPYKFIELRDRVIIRMLSDTGIRVSELTALNISDVGLTDTITGNHIPNAAEIHTRKTTEKRVIMWSEQTHRELNQYLGTRLCLTSSQPLFISTYSKYPRITTRQVERIIKEVSRRAGIKKNVTPHSFRHGKAHDMLSKGANVKEIQSVLGHSELNPRASFQYIRLGAEEQKKILKKYV